MKLLHLSLVAAALCGPLVAEEVVDLGQISVTATRTERNVQDVPASIEIITEKEIRNSVAQSADELLKEVAGVDLKHSIGLMSTGTTNKVTLRGFGGSTESRTLLLVDGVPMNDAYFGGVEWNQIPVSAIKRIEIVKGAGSALYGSNAMGGVINIITKTPETAESGAVMSYGSMDTQIASLSTAGKIEKIGYMLSGQMAKSDGYIADVPPNIAPNTIKRGMERENLTAKLSYDLDESSSIGTSYLYFHNNSKGVYQVPGGYNPYEQEMQTLQANYRKTFGNESELQLTLYDKENKSSYDSLNSDKLSVKYADSTDIDEFGGTLQYTYPLGSHIVTGGVDFKMGAATSEDDYSTGENVTVEGKQDYYGIFLQDEMFLSEAWVVNVGGRLDFYRSHDGKGHDETQDPTADTVYPSKTFHAFSPKIGVLYHVAEGTALRSSVGKAFRAPTVYDLYRDWTYYSLTYAGNPDLDPETVLSYEIGIDQKIGSKGSVNVTAYRSDAKDFIYSITPLDPESTNYKEKTNVGKVKIYGVEVALNYAFTDEWRLLADYTYNRSTIEEFEADTTYEGKYLTDVPKHKGSVSVTYANPDIATVKASVRYVGDRYSDDKNSESKVYENYTLCDLKISKSFSEHIEASLSVDDLFDTKYTEFYVSPGRVIMGSLNMSF